MQSAFHSPTDARAIEAGAAADGTPRTATGYSFGKYFWLTLVLFILTVVCVSPFWNTAVGDDWAYELTVKHLLDTGHYKLHEWATANMPFQVYWGALFAGLAGYSHASLRISTLVLWLVALIAFYCLGLEQGFTPEGAGLLMLTLFVSPLVVELSFSFMTDVPYLSCFIITLFFYTRAIRTRHLGLMFLGSMAAAAAILTRQFGAALIGGLVLVWLAHRERARNAVLFGVGLLLPLLALGWQVHQTSSSPTWTMKWNLFNQAEYFSAPTTLLKSLAWRPVIVLEYLAFFAPPLVLLPLARLIARGRGATSQDRPRSREFWVLLCVAVCVIGVLMVSSLWRMAPPLMPHLPWNFDVLYRGPVFARAFLTGLTTIGAILFGWTFAQRYLAHGDWKDVRCHERLVDLVTLCAVGEVLAFWMFGDEYLLPLLPYTLVVVGRQCRTVLDRIKRPFVASCLAVLALSIAFARPYLAMAEALWRGAEAVRMTGVESCEIFSSFEWMGYFRFDEFLAEHRTDFPPDMDVFDNWLAVRKVRAKYLVTAKPTSRDSRNYEVFMKITYTPLLFWERKVYVLRRIDHPPPR